MFTCVRLIGVTIFSRPFSLDLYTITTFPSFPVMDGTNANKTSFNNSPGYPWSPSGETKLNKAYDVSGREWIFSTSAAENS